MMHQKIRKEETMRRLVRKHRNQIILIITMLAVLNGILSAKCFGQGRGDEEIILFVVSAIWLVLFSLANWKRLWKG